MTPTKVLASRLGLAAACLLAWSFSAQGQAISEGFETVVPAGWTAVNNSTTVGTTTVFQGNDTVFPAQAGTTTSYAGMNYNATTGANTISVWLITPLRAALGNGDTWSFFTRTTTPGATVYPDRMEFRVSTNGACSPGTGPTSVGDFTTVLTTINPSLTTTGYPSVWTNFSGALSGLSGGASGCFAFRYYVTDGGPSGTNSDYIGVDTFAYAPNPFVKGDFNADGKPDLVFRNLANLAQNKIWYMDGVTRTAEAAITPDAASTAWKVRGTDDFDNFATPGAGKDSLNDLVFWNESTGNVEFWLMNGVTRPGSPVALTGGAVLPTNWDLSATGDFNADGKPDIVWRNFTSQKIVIWTMNGTAKVGNIIPSPDQAVDANWIIVAAADYNNDGNRDFLWYNFTSGKIVTWYMNASVARTAGLITTPANAGDANWKVVASADYSAAYVPGTPPLGSPDIVWRNETSGNQVVWHLDFNSTRVHGQFTNPAANTPALDWTIVGPR